MSASATLTSESAAADHSDVAPWWKVSPDSRRGLILIAAATCLVGLGYSLYTQQIWEDALITLRHSENLINGNGLVYNVGERIHGFTSPVNVLLLAVCHVLTGQSSYVSTLWLYRIFTIAAFAGGSVFVVRATAKENPRWTPALWFLALIYMSEPKTVAYCCNGMETGFMMLLVGWAIYILMLSPADHWLQRGFCWGALMWTRPDGCVYIATLSLAELLYFRERPWRETLKSLAKSAGICALVYAPWFLWAWWYYGSPIPQTVIAKANVEKGSAMQLLDTLERMPENLFSVAGRSFRPIQFPLVEFWVAPQPWPHVIFVFSKIVGAFALIYWLLPVPDRLGRAASFCYTILCGYFSVQVIPYLWYYPPALIFAMIALARGLTMLVMGVREIGFLARWSNLVRGVAVAIIVVLVVGQFTEFAANTRAEMVWQKEIEDGQRAVIGAWLKEHGKPDETVYLEPLGYIGYFSGMKMLDFPGLVSPEVVRVRREKQVDRSSAIQYLMPDWLVLRHWEANRVITSPYGKQFEKDYHLEHNFNVNDKVDQYGQIPTNSILRYDAAFAIFRKNSNSGPSTPPQALPPEN